MWAEQHSPPIEAATLTFTSYKAGGRAYPPKVFSILKVQFHREGWILPISVGRQDASQQPILYDKTLGGYARPAVLP